MEFNSFLGVKIIHLVEKADLFKIGILWWKESVMSLYSSLEGQRHDCNDCICTVHVERSLNC